jgi:hypothetical protein
VLLYPTFQEISRFLEPYNDVKADNLSLKGDRPTLGQLLSFASQHLMQLRNIWEYVVGSIGIPPEDLPVSPPSQVPTAAPRELLLHLLVNRPQMVEKMSQDGIGTVLGKDLIYITEVDMDDSSACSSYQRIRRNTIYSLSSTGADQA